MVDATRAQGSHTGRVSGCDRGCDACVNFGEETREHRQIMSPTCQGKAAAYLLSLCAPLLRSITPGRGVSFGNLRDEELPTLSHLLGAITHLGQSLAIIAD